MWGGGGGEEGGGWTDQVPNRLQYAGGKELGLGNMHFLQVLAAPNLF